MNFLHMDKLLFYFYSTLCCVSPVVKVSLFRLWHFRWPLHHCCAVFGVEGGSSPRGEADLIKPASSWVSVLQVLKEPSSSAPRWRMQRRRNRRSVLIVASASPLDPRLLSLIYTEFVPAVGCYGLFKKFS